MKKNIPKYGIALVVLLFYLNFNTYSQTEIDNENFESGWGIWNDGGDDCERTNTSTPNGTYMINLQDDSDEHSSMTTDNIDITSYGSVEIAFDYEADSMESGEDFWIRYSDDGGSSWTTIATFVSGTDFNNNSPESVSETIDSGTYTFASNSRFRIQCDASGNGDDIFIDNVVITGYPASPEIEIQGNSTEIVNGDTSPSITDDTDYGTANIGTLITRTFTINNSGTVDLNISSISLSNTTDFSITGTPYSTPVSASGSTTFTVTFNSVSIGTKTCDITVNNDDSNEGTYTFRIEASAQQNFFDSDNDGVYDNIDIDDDNDGILDSEEELSCQNSSIANAVNYKFLNETFGTGTSRATINTTYDAETTYCYEDGTTIGSDCASQSNINLSDGQYVVYYQAADGDGTNDTPNGEVASWADAYWYTGEDHTAGDTNGRFAMFNASYDPGTFYTATIIGALPNIPITYSFWVLNLDTTTAPGIGSRLRPDILVEFRDVNGTVLASITTGDIPPSINGDPDGSWHQFTANLTLNVSEFYVYFINNEVGGLGNDVAIDDITISQTLCDSDNDGVADVFDLDSDNDGIPDVVEAGLGNYSEGKATLTGVASWADTNSNGMHDATESNTVPDSDGDGTPNYLDLDSDNDTIFDVDESGATNSGDANYQNGDGDITGDGVGDGADTDTVRETDVDSDGTVEYFTDGILDLYDFFEGGTMATAYGNSNQGSTGTGWEYYVADTDNDGTPDYLDVTSDGTNFDITNTLYSSLDGDADGIIDDTSDSDEDGIVDLFDTDDALFGSPRDLNTKLQLFFDGRNDYAEETTVISDTWDEASIMAWIKIDPSASGDQVILGQDEFYIQLNSDKTITVYADGNTLNYTTPLTDSKWIHLAATFKCDCLSGNFNLYVNGNLEETSTPSSGGFNTDTSSFTIGKQPDTDSKYFHGYIDEVRVFSKALTANEIHKMVYQEIEDNGGIVRGSIIPVDIDDFDTVSETSTPLNWSNLERYYRLDTYKDDIIDDLTTASVDTETGAKIYNSKLIESQTAPLPFATTNSCSGLWTDTNNWEHGSSWDITNTDSNCAIIEVNGTLETSTHHNLTGLIMTSGSQLNVTNDSELNVSWYLELDGKIDLGGESQLVQGAESVLEPTSEGTLERDQQGTSDTYTYNYWSSPVGVSNSSTNNNAYKVTDIFTNVTFSSSGYDGTESPLTIADYWIFKFANFTLGDYSAWQHVRSTGTLQIGEGFTMKGPGSGLITDEQNYVLEGKPNNGDIDLTINSGNEYLVGNPYPSALDAHEFILDNGNTIQGTGSTTGTLYFWEHWGGGSHILREYQGGYATYTLSGGVPAASQGSNHPDVGTGGTPTKTPGRYIPVGQGFFVKAENTGIIKFRNSQRVFQVEDGSSSLFLKPGKKNSGLTSKSTSSGDSRLQLRLGFYSSNTIRRQLLTTVDENSSLGYDWGYDAPYNDSQIDDMYWLINDDKYMIQGIDNIDETTVLPIGIHTKDNGINSITIDSLENAPSNLEVYLHDKELDYYHDLKESNYDVFLTSGEYLNRFEITFSNFQTLGTNEAEHIPIQVYYSNKINSIIILNPESRFIKSIEMLNLLGQSLFKFNTNNTKQNYIKYKAGQIATGNYVINIETEYSKISKKVLVKK
ncbi:LamG-like jellyroll fold domain-containing protein [Seonamhaeicola sp. ML3]|uniref:LamG-like jellyroll fold domain-containing protein n=1 Tax=Seonamhaeicola sp. ML3 TaxID=2937786 RepID=UPI00200C2EF6|nr:LamG-like jellyroll fold domain-containing protein [Seonamhaeicola sp. ML3]